MLLYAEFLIAYFLIALIVGLALTRDVSEHVEYSEWMLILAMVLWPVVYAVGFILMILHKEL